MPRTPRIKHKNLAAKVPALYARWLDGERYPALATEAGVPIATLRHHFIKQAGGPDRYKQATEDRRSEHPVMRTHEQKEERKPDDSEVVTLTSTPITEGWNCERRYGGELREETFAGRRFRFRTGRPYDVVIAPDLTEYVTAGEYEEADLVLRYEGLLPWRLKIHKDGK